MNLYYTPMGSQAFDIHYDVTGAFILQVRGWVGRCDDVGLPSPRRFD